MDELKESLIQKNITTLDNFKEIIKDNNKIEISLEFLKYIPTLIETIDNLINIINLRIELTDEEEEYVKTIKNNVDEIKKIF